MSGLKEVVRGKQAVDTTTPPEGRSCKCSGYLPNSSAIIQEWSRAGLARAREKGTKSGRPMGRARIDATKEAAIRTALASGKGILRTAREGGTGTSVVQRIRAEVVRRKNADQ